MTQSEKMIFVDGREISVSFAADRNTAIIHHIKQILLSSYMANAVKPQSGDILEFARNREIISVRAIPHAP